MHPVIRVLALQNRSRARRALLESHGGLDHLIVLLFDALKPDRPSKRASDTLRGVPNASLFLADL